MTTGGWINMAISVGFVTCLFAWCIYKVLTQPGKDGVDLHAQTTIDPHDQVD